MTHCKHLSLLGCSRTTSSWRATHTCARRRRNILPTAQSDELSRLANRTTRSALTIQPAGRTFGAAPRGRCGKRTPLAERAGLNAEMKMEKLRQDSPLRCGFCRGTRFAIISCSSLNRQCDGARAPGPDGLVLEQVPAGQRQLPVVPGLLLGPGRPVPQAVDRGLRPQVADRPVAVCNNRAGSDRRGDAAVVLVLRQQGKRKGAFHSDAVRRDRGGSRETCGRKTVGFAASEAPANPNRKRVGCAVALRCRKRSTRITAAIPVDGTAGIVVKRGAPPLCTGMHAAAELPGMGGHRQPAKLGEIKCDSGHRRTSSA